MRNPKADSRQLTGNVELRTSALLSGSSDRPSFLAKIERGFSGSRAFQVFILPQGLLCMELKKKLAANTEPSKGVVVAAGVLGGAMGVLLAHACTSGINQQFAQWESGFDTLSDDELFAVAAQRKRSFVVKRDDLTLVTISAPSAWGRTFGNSKLAGRIKLSGRGIGNVTLEIYDPSHMCVAIESLPRRFGDCVVVKARLDQQTKQFVPL